jgi:hypothetical protein
MADNNISTDNAMSEKTAADVPFGIDRIIHVSVSPEEDAKVLRKIDIW